MGYYTRFSLDVSIYTDSEDTEALEREIKKMGVFYEGSIFEGLYAEAKWYDYNEDMMLLSSRFPSILFTLNGDGDDADDIWCHYYMGGKVMYDGIEVKYNLFDEKRLVDDMPSDKTEYSYET